MVFHVFAITDYPKYTSADTAETVYANLNCHYAASLSISMNWKPDVDCPIEASAA
jgi:hypothetical protein